MRHCRVTFKIVTGPIRLLEINMRYNNSYCCFRSQIKLTYMSSWKSSKEGDFPLCALCQRGSFYVKPFCDINFVYQHSNSGWIFEYDEIFLPYNGLKLFIWCITFNHCSWWILCWLSNAFSLQNSIQFILFEEKMIGRKWGSKRGRFPFLAHLSQRLEWAIVVAHRPSSVRPSVVRRPCGVNFSHFRLLLQNRLMDFDETW